MSSIDAPDSQRNRSFRADMEAWSRICDDLWIWNYNTNFRYYDLPFPNLHVIGSNLRYFARNHAKGVFMQANGNGNTGEMCDLRNYVMARCLWNPSLDSWALAREFCLLHYGHSGKTIFDYLTYIHKNAKRNGFEPTCFPMPFEIGITPDSSRKIYDYFVAALAQAENDVVRNRVEKASISAYRAVLEVCGDLNVQQGRMRVVYPQYYGDVIGNYMALTKKYGQTRAEEWQPIEHYYQLLNKATTTGYPAQLLENKHWRLLVVGDELGKTVVLHHKPSRRDLLMPQGYRSLRFLLDYMVFYEINLQAATESIAYHIEKVDTGLRLSKTLTDGTVVERQIGFDPKNPASIRYQTTIHQGDGEEAHQLRIHPEFYTGQVTSNYRIVSAYIRDDSWIRFNQGWRKSEGPNRGLLESALGGGYAFFNHAQRYGMVLYYDPASINRPAFWWSDTYPQLHLDLITNPVHLQFGEVFRLDYQMNFLNRPPNRKSIPPSIRSRPFPK